MSPKKKLDKRLYAAKVIGIILFAMSILLFCTYIIAGLMSIFIVSHFNEMEANRPLLSESFNWLFRHYPVLSFSISLIWVPFFFSSLALYKFKEWGRVVSVIMLFFMILILVIVSCLMLTVKDGPFIFMVLIVISYTFYIAALAVGAYFLMRRSTREGIRDHNLAVAATAEPAPVMPPSVVPAPVIKDPRYELAKELVAEVTEKTYPSKRKNAALIVAGIMMIAFPAFWALISLIITFLFLNILSLISFLTCIVSVFTLLMGITVIWHRKRYRLRAILACIGSIVMMINPWTFFPIPFIVFFVAYFIAILVLLLLNYNKFFEEEMDDDATATNKTLSPMEMEK
jgi:hypothetical protein